MWIVAFAVYIRFIFFFATSFTPCDTATVARFRTLLWMRRFIWQIENSALPLNVLHSQSLHRNDFPLTDWAWLHSVDGWLTAFASRCAHSVRNVDTAHKWINCLLLLLLLNARVKNGWFWLHTHTNVRPFATTDRSKLTDGARLHKCFIAGEWNKKICIRMCLQSIWLISVHVIFFVSLLFFLLIFRSRRVSVCLDFFRFLVVNVRFLVRAVWTTSVQWV